MLLWRLLRMVRPFPVRLLALFLLTPGAVTAQVEVEAAPDAVALVRAVHFEGVPYEAARGIDALGCAALRDLLADPAEAKFHANAIEALGIAECAGTYEALAAYASQQGEVDRLRYRALRAVPLAMGYLARSDPRGLSWLLERADRRTPPAWSHGRQQGARLHAARRRDVVNALGVCGKPLAEAWLIRHAAQAADPATRDRADEALAHSRRIRQEGADAVLAHPAGRAR